MFKLRLQLVRDGASRRLDFLFSQEFAKRFPNRVIDLLAEVIRSMLHLWEEGEEGARRDGWPYWISRHAADGVLLAAQEEPVFTWETLLPIVLNTVENHPVTEHRWDEQSFWPDSIWNDRLYRFDQKGAEPLPAVLASAGGHWLRIAFADAAMALQSLFSRQSRTVQQVIGTAWLRGPDEAADDALAWLAGDGKRFDLAEIGTSRIRTLARQLIARFAPLCSAEVYHQLEAAALAYYPLREVEDYKFRLKSYREGTRWYSANNYGFSQYAILSALPPERRSSIVANALGQFWAKYVRSAEDIESDNDFKGGFMSSPISSHSARLSDNAWLVLLSRGPQSNRRRPQSIRTLLQSSPEMFARDLAFQAERDPRRFASLALNAPRDIPPKYWSSLLRAVGLVEYRDETLGNWEPATEDQCRAILERIGYDLDAEVGAAFCQCIAERPECGTDPVVLQALCRYATEHPNPEHDGCVLLTDSEQRLETEAINTVRALAAAGIAAILYLKTALVHAMLPAITSLVGDKVACVRTAAIRAIVPILNADRDLAVDLFLAALRETNEEVVRTFHARRFLGYVIKSHRVQVEPLIQRMASSTLKSIAQEGAAWVTAIRLFTGNASQAFRRCLSGSAAHRQGVAETLAQQLDDEEFAPACCELLPQFFDDQELQVRNAAAKALRNNEVNWSKSENARLLERYFLSKAFLDELTFSLWTLKEFKGNLIVMADAIIAACDACSKLAVEAAPDYRADFDSAFRALSDLLLRLYGQTEHSDRELRKKCLDRWDAILQNARWVSADMLASLDT